MLRIGPEPTNGSISAINIRDNEKVVGILKEPTGEYSLDVSGTINCDTLLVNGTVFSGGGGSGVWDLSDSNIISYTNGNVGIGTTDPAYELDVSGDVGINGSLRIGGTQGVSRFMGETDYSACFKNYIYAPAIINYLEEGNNPAGIVFGDASANLTDQISLITKGITRVYINASGNVGIGTTDPAYELDVSGTINCDELITGTIIDPDGLKINAETGDGGFTNNIALNIGENNTNTGPTSIILFANSTQTIEKRQFISAKAGGRFEFGYSSNTAGTDLTTIYIFKNNGTATASTWSSTSDERMKFDVNDLSGCLSTIQQLEPKTYLKGDKPNEDRTKQNYLNQESGFLAQDIQKIDTLKHLVSSGSPEIEGVETEMLYLDYGSFIPYLVGAMKEQQIVIDSLTAKNDALQNELTSLKTILQSKGILD